MNVHLFVELHIDYSASLYSRIPYVCVLKLWSKFHVFVSKETDGCVSYFRFKCTLPQRDG